MSTRPQHFERKNFGRAFSLLEKRSMIDFPIRSLSARIWPQEFFFAQEFGRAFSLLEKRSMIDFPIRSYWTATNDRFSNKKLRPPGICLGATWAGIFFYTEIADLWRLGFIYTEFADAWRLDFIYTEIADTLVVEGFARRRHCFCFIPDASKISSSFSCRFFLS